MSNPQACERLVQLCVGGQERILDSNVDGDRAIALEVGQTTWSTITKGEFVIHLSAISEVEPPRP